MEKESISFKIFQENEITDCMLSEASQLFNAHYGVWTTNPAIAIPPHATRAHHIRLSPARLRLQCLPESMPSRPCTSAYIRASLGGQSIGHAFATVFSFPLSTTSPSSHSSIPSQAGPNSAPTTGIWITQLVIHRDYRRRRVATILLTRLLTHLRAEHDATLCGIASSQPAACMAAARAWGCGIEGVRVGFIGEVARDMVGAVPVDYVREGRLRGRVFEKGGKEEGGHERDMEDVVSALDTNFLVDHAEPLAVLEEVRRERGWPLGELPERHEFLLILG